VEEREQARRAVAALLNQVTTEQDLQVVLLAEALARGRRLARLLRDDDEDLESRSLLGWLHWYRYQALPAGQDQQDLATAVELFTPCFLAAGGGLPEPLLPVLASRAASTAVVLLERALGTADPTLLSAAIQLLERILTVTPASDPDRAAMLSNLGAALLTRFERGGVLADLDAAIEVGREAVAATPAGHPGRAGHLSNLGIALRTRFERNGIQADWETAVAAFAEAAGAGSAAPSTRIGAARAAAALTAERQPGRAALLVEEAVLLLPEVAPRHLERSDQQYAIGRLAGLAADSAALALADTTTPAPERAERAVRLRRRPGRCC